jgi:exodeoxyribonuclease VII small subunit
MSDKQKLSYQAALQELQSIVAALQEENTGMDELSAKVARASFLLQYCKEKLRTIEEETAQALKG